MRYEIITALNTRLHTQYAHKSMNSWQDLPVIYWEGDLIDPRWNLWRTAAKMHETGRIERECVRFSHKVQAQIHHSRQCRADYMIWLDADVVQHAEYTEQEFLSLMPADDELCTFLDRQPVKYAETGWIAYNMHHPRLKEFMRRLEDIYLNREIFTLKQTHDAFVWDYIRQRGNYPGRNLLHKAKSSEPFDDSDLAPWFRHHKGQRKRLIK
jgi:hypothetical protein